MVLCPAKRYWNTIHRISSSHHSALRLLRLCAQQLLHHIQLDFVPLRKHSVHYAGRSGSHTTVGTVTERCSHIVRHLLDLVGHFK